jgi:hypothetical protein
MPFRLFLDLPLHPRTPVLRQIDIAGGWGVCTEIRALNARKNREVSALLSLDAVEAGGRRPCSAIYNL